MLAVKRDELSASLDAQPLDKREANAILRQMVSAITVDYDAGELVIEWAHGGLSLVVYAMPPATKQERQDAERIAQKLTGGNLRRCLRWPNRSATRRLSREHSARHSDRLDTRG